MGERQLVLSRRECVEGIQVLGILVDRQRGTMEYFLDGEYLGEVFSNLPEGELRVAVSNGWQGRSAFALLGQTWV